MTKLSDCKVQKDSRKSYVPGSQYDAGVMRLQEIEHCRY